MIAISIAAVIAALIAAVLGIMWGIDAHEQRWRLEREIARQRDMKRARDARYRARKRVAGEMERF